MDDVRDGVEAERAKISELVCDWTTTMNKRWEEEETARENLVDELCGGLQQEVEDGRVEIKAAISDARNSILNGMEMADMTRLALHQAVEQARVEQQKYDALVRDTSKWTDTCVERTAAVRDKAHSAILSLQERTSEVRKRLTPLLKEVETKREKLQEVTERSEMEAKRLEVGYAENLARLDESLLAATTECTRAAELRVATVERQLHAIVHETECKLEAAIKDSTIALLRERTAAIDAIALHARSATSIAPRESAPASISASAVRSSGAREDQDDLKETMDVLKRAVCALEKGSAGLTALLAAGSNASGPIATAAFDGLDPTESAGSTAFSESPAESAVLLPEENSSSSSSRPLSPVSMTLSDMELELAMLRASGQVEEA